MIQSMRSGIVAMPGEVNSCVGCHDDRNSTPLAPTAALAAMRKPPFHVSEKTAETTGNFSYQAEVQPIFDKHCVSCHDYGKEPGEKLNLCGDKTAIFSVSYIELHRKKLINSPGGGANRIYKAYEWGSHQSKLIQVLEAGHEAVTLTAAERRTLSKWIDLNAPYYPDYSTAYAGFPGGRCPLTGDELAQISQLTKTRAISFNHGRPYILNFDRPMHSPILSHVTDAAIRAQVIAIIDKGAERLKQTPRNDMPGYVPGPRDAQRLARYQELSERERANRQAALAGEKRYDPGISR
jgi:uncharacterized protein YjhX (UPF0386 family)